MKQQYMNELEQLLNQYKMEPSEKEEILNDYQEMYDNYKDFGMMESEIRAKLGEPSDIIEDLTEGYMKLSQIKEKQSSSRKNKAVALMPFVSLILFFALGFGFNLWAFSWMAFLLIPVVAIIVNTGLSKEMLISISPFVAVVGYLILGFVANLWHPGWLIFLIIPVSAILLEHKGSILGLLTALSPFVALSIFFLYFAEQGMYNPGWLIFLIIPALGALNEKSLFRILLWEFFIIGGAVAYVYLGEMNGYTEWTYLVFAPALLYAILVSDIRIVAIPREFRLIILGAIVVYVLLGVASPLVGINLWGWAWLVFFSIPVYAIYTTGNQKDRIIAYMPFVSVTIFYTLGYFFDWWAFAWLAFLLIPMVAIIKEA